MSKSLGELNKELREKFGTENNKFSDFEIGDEILIVCTCADFTFFKEGTTARIVRMKDGYLGIIVEFKDGKTFNFNPEDIKKIGNSKIIACKRCGINIYKRVIRDELAEICHECEDRMEQLKKDLIYLNK